jgi:glutathione S-transferase
VLALATHLGLELDIHESVIGEKPEGVFAYSARGAIPLLVHGEVVLIESRVMLEHLAEHAGWTDALPGDLALRSRHRLAMAIADLVLAAHLFSDAPDEGRIEDACRALGAATRTTPAAPCLLAFQAAPIWARYRLFRPDHPIVAHVERDRPLTAWLDAVAALPSVVCNLPDRTVIAEDIARARRAGLVPDTIPWRLP